MHWKSTNLEQRGRGEQEQAENKLIDTVKVAATTKIGSHLCVFERG